MNKYEMREHNRDTEKGQPRKYSTILVLILVLVYYVLVY